MESKQALIAGINIYDTAPELRFACHDASEFSSALELPEYSFGTKLLLDEDVTTTAFTQSITDLLKSEVPTKLIYFAGHGYTTDEGVFLVTTDGSPDNPGIDLEWLGKQILSANDTVIVILDCCHSGGASVRDGIATNRQLSNNDIERSLGTFGRGKILLAACSSDEAAMEQNNTTHGAFTFHLLEGMMGQASNLRGVVTPFGLFDYAATKLAEDDIQTPVFKGEQAGSIILGAGFAPPGLFSLNPLTLGETNTELNVIAHLESEATQHLDQYLQQTAIPYEKWKSEGYHKATQLLEPILRWFSRTVSENPELLSRKAFTDAFSEAKARQTQLGALSEGTFTGVGRVDKQLGSGGFGTVWKIVNPDERPLAYKVYHSNEIHIRDKVARFERGYRAMLQLEHPHIVKVHKYSNCPVGFYMDFVDGPNLRDFIGALTEPAETLQLLIKVAETLRHAHGRNVIHRDVKPENIVLGFDQATQIWIPYLTDFDLAWFSAATQLTKEGLGAIHYAAPEQLSKPSSRSAHAPTTDVYSFGQLCFFAATGSDPVAFNGADNASGLRSRIGNWRVQEAANIFAGLYDQCTKPDPHERLKDFRTISDTLFEAHRLIGEADVSQQIGQERFFRELEYALAGLSDNQDGITDAIYSLSGRTLISVSQISAFAQEVEFTVRLEQGHLSLSGNTTESARRILNSRLEKAMGEYQNVTRRPGTEGTYQVFLDISRIEPSLRGVDICRSIIARAIDTVESR